MVHDSIGHIWTHWFYSMSQCFAKNLLPRIGLEHFIGSQSI